MLFMHNIEPRYLRRTSPVGTVKIGFLNPPSHPQRPLLYLSAALAEGTDLMNETEVPELVGKTITCAKLMSTATEEQELLLSFDDGTSFAFSACSKVVAKGVL